MTRRSALIIAAGLAGCAGGAVTPAPTTVAGSERSSEATGQGAGAVDGDWSDWRSWTKVNAARFKSKGHGGKWVDVYVEAANADLYRAGAGPIPAGMRVVKAGYKDEAGTQFAALTVMAKKSPGYDADHGDWYYGVLTEDGGTAKMQGKLGMCIDCHTKAAERDYLFGLPGR